MEVTPVRGPSVHAATARAASTAATARFDKPVERARVLRREARQHQALVMRDDLKRMNTELEKEGLKPGKKIKVGTQEG